ncbi:hypothetical protein HRI_002286300 [Hibiscus trionum]|uniref:Bromo domain-containing protein n=1 Tax=Hibiscus trionum TaxID=183268 RepID=A0A9W7I249_HIBTR|nr:hypothetical protein HRI_002286300 [Hibiscus trionum]
MSSGEYRRSPRIVELDARKAQARRKNKGNVICEVTDKEELEKGRDILKQKRGRKKVKVRTVQDLVVNSVEYNVQKTDAGNDENGLVKNAAVATSGDAIPEKGKLELLLGILQRRDTYKIFAEPVNPEKVEYYYDVIKEPMDFGTVAKKLNEGCYQTLEEFEHDVFLVSNNAMVFNASNTIYYRQARALKELATKLFHALKTDPESLETEASVQRMGPGKRTKARVGILNCNNKSNTSIAARGYRAHRRFNDVDVERRRTYRPWESFRSENGSLISAVYNNPKQLGLNAEADIGYLESLKRFSKDLGPVAQKVAMEKVESYVSEAVRVWHATTNRQVWPPNMQIPNPLVASNIKVAPSIKVPSSTPGCQNISGDKMNILGGFSHGGQASIDDNRTINNALTGGISQSSGRVESLGDLQGNMIPSVSRGFAPSLHLLGDSSGFQTLAGKTMDGPSYFWNRGKVSAGYNVDMNDALNKGKGKLGDELDFQKKLMQPLRVGLDSGVSFKDYATNQSNGVHLESSFPNYGSGKGKLGDGVDFQEKLMQPMRVGLNSGASFKDYVTNQSNGVHLESSFPNSDSGKGKLGDGVDFQEKLMQPMRVSLDGGVAFKDYATNQSNGVHLESSFPNYDSGKGKLGDGVDFQEKLMQPMRVGLDRGVTFKDYATNRSNGVHLESSFPNHDSGKGKLGDGVDFQEKLMLPMRVGLDSGVAFKDYATNQSNGVHLESSFPNYDPGKVKLDLSSLWNTKGKQKELGETSMMINPTNVDNSVQNAGHASSWWRMQECLPQSNSGASSSAWRSPSQVMTGLNGFQTIDYMTGIGSHYSGKAMSEKDVIADGEGSRYRTNVEQGGVVSDLLKPLEMGMQSPSGIGSHYPGKAMCEKDFIADGEGSRCRTDVGGVVSDLLKPLEMRMQSPSEFCFQEETLTPELASLLEQKGELEALCEPPTDEDWFRFFPEENEMRASEKALEYESFQPESSGAAAERRQKQTVEGREQAQWWL